MKTKNKILMIMLFAALGVGLAACDPNGDIVSGTSGNLNVSPPEANFAATKINETSVQTFELTNNASSGTLKIVQAKIIEERNENADDRSEYAKGDRWVEKDHLLKPGEKITLDVKYRPQDRFADKGVLRVFVVGDAKYPDGYVDIPLKSEDIAPAILTTNPVVIKNRVRPQQWSCRDEVVQNIGVESLKISNIALNPPGRAFHVRYFATKPEDSTTCGETHDIVTGVTLDDILSTGDGQKRLEDVIASKELAPGKSFYVRYFFVPPSANPDSANLVLATNIPSKDSNSTSSTYSINIKANSDGCLEIIPGNINFGSVKVDETETVDVTLRNCGPISTAAPLKIKKISVSGEFTLDFADADEESKLTDSDDNTYIELAQNQSKSFKVKVEAPSEEKTLKGKLVVEMADSSYQEEVAEVVAEVVRVLPPRPKAYVSKINIEPNDSGGTQLNTKPQTYGTQSNEKLKPTKKVQLDTDVTLDDKTCTPTYEWRIVKQPVKDATILGDQASAKNPVISLNNVGEYIFAVKVTCGDKSSDEEYVPSRVTLVVKPETPVYIELTWLAPQANAGGPIPAQAKGPDLDLFLTSYPTGVGIVKHAFNDAPRSVYPSDDQSHKRFANVDVQYHHIKDDKYGPGPEAIEVTKASTNTTFDVGIENFRSNNYPYAKATVKIYTDGVLNAVFSNIDLKTKQFAWVATIQYGATNSSSSRGFTGRIIAAGKIYQEIVDADTNRTRRN